MEVRRIKVSFRCVLKLIIMPYFFMEIVSNIFSWVTSWMQYNACLYTSLADWKLASSL